MRLVLLMRRSAYLTPFTPQFHVLTLVLTAVLTGVLTDVLTDVLTRLFHTTEKKFSAQGAGN